MITILAKQQQRERERERGGTEKCGHFSLAVISSFTCGCDDYCQPVEQFVEREGREKERENKRKGRREMRKFRGKFKVREVKEST